eukprot:9079294-Lingulodinium_polyedra.AAC.1
MPPGAVATYTAALATISRTAVWGPGWILSGLETHWLVSGGPRCPTTAAASSTIAALLAGRFCGPQPFVDKAIGAIRELQEFATKEEARNAGQ